jgi:hypothetical protein
LVASFVSYETQLETEWIAVPWFFSGLFWVFSFLSFLFFSKGENRTKEKKLFFLLVSLSLLSSCSASGAFGFRLNLVAVMRQRRMSRDGYGLPKLSLGHAVP